MQVLAPPLPEPPPRAQAPGSGTAGWFARDAETFALISGVLLDEAIPAALPRRLVIAGDAFAFAEPEVEEALRAVHHEFVEGA